jgi:glycosyltransferase involved in cell wall biosynthesis
LAADGVPVHPVPWRAALDPRALPALLRETHTRDSVVHAHDPHALALVAAAEALGGAPLVATRRTLRPRRAVALWRRPDVVVAASEAARARLVEEGLDSTRIVVIPPGVALAEARAAAPAGLRAPLGFPADAPVALTLVPFGEGRGGELLLEAARRLAVVTPALRWLLVGDGPGRTTLQRLARTLGVAERVRFLRIPDDPQPLLADASVFVLAATRESHDPALLEAMAMGVPVVAVRTPTRLELVGDAAGLLVPPEEPASLADAVHRLVVEPAFAEVLVRAAGARIERFDVARMVSAHLSVYRSLDAFR